MEKMKEVERKEKIEFIGQVILMFVIMAVIITALIIFPNRPSPDDRFIILDHQRIDGTDYYILCDKETRVMYISKGDTLTVMVDENGQPLLYDGELETKENTK